MISYPKLFYSKNINIFNSFLENLPFCSNWSSILDNFLMIWNRIDKNSIYNEPKEYHFEIPGGGR